MLSHFLIASAGSPRTITYDANYTDTGSSTNYNITILEKNYPAGLWVVGVIAENATVSGRTLDSVTFESDQGNTDLTSIVNTPITTGANGTLIAAIFAWNRPNGGTPADPNIKVSFSGLMSRVNIGLWRINGISSTTSFATATSSITGTASNRTNTLTNLQSNSVGVSILANGAKNTVSWTNATERYEAFSTGTGGAGADFKTTADGDRTITATSTSGSTDGLVLVSAVWR